MAPLHSTSSWASSMSRGLVPGSANQGQMAATVAEHFSQTPHTVEQGSSPLGAITWLKFRLTVHVPAGFVAAKGLKADKKGCR